MSVYIESSPRPRVSQFAVPCVANRHLSVATGTRSRLTAWLTGLCLLTALAASFRAEAQCDPPPSGITDFWEGDGSTLDVVGGNNGILMSNATDTAVGKVNQAFGFDGVRSFVEIPDAPTFHPTNFTFEAWVNFTSLTSTV